MIWNNKKGMLQNLKTVKALGKDSREIFAVVDKYYFTIL